MNTALNKTNLLYAIKKKPLIIRNCSICEYPLAYFYNGEQFGFDAGCDCTNRYGGWEPRSTEDIDFYLNEPSWTPKLQAFIEEVMEEFPRPMYAEEAATYFHDELETLKRACRKFLAIINREDKIPYAGDELNEAWRELEKLIDAPEGFKEHV